MADDTAATGELLPGVSVEPLSDETRKQFRVADSVEGLVITELADTSPFQESFRQGAVIEQINRVPVKDLASARKALRDGRNIALVYYRDVYRYVIFQVR